MSQTPKRIGAFVSRLSAFHLLPPCDPQFLQLCIDAWRSCITEQVALHVTPSLYLKGKLTLLADSSVWLHKLLQQRSSLIRQLRQHTCFHDLVDIHIRVVPLATRKIRQSAAPPDLSPGVRSVIAESAESIADPVLAGALRRLAGSRQK